jgi:hypothetical protein
MDVDTSCLLQIFRASDFMPHDKQYADKYWSISDASENNLEIS